MIDEKMTVPIIHNRNELKLYLNPLYIIDNYTVDMETYENFYNRINNIIKGCITIKACREYPIKFKFYAKDTKTHTLQLRHFLTNIILWNAFIALHGIDGVMDESFILDCSKDISNINEYLNYKIISVLRDYNIKSTQINYLTSSILYKLRYISADFSLILGLNFSLNTFINDYENNPRLKEIMENTFDADMQPHEIEEKMAKLQDEEIAIYKATKNHPIGVMLNANSGVKHKQLAEFTISDGLFPTLSGRTIPEPIENSLLIKGFDRPSYFYISAIGSRKSLVLNKKVIDILVTAYSNICCKTSLIAGNSRKRQSAAKTLIRVRFNDYRKVNNSVEYK